MASFWLTKQGRQTAVTLTGLTAVAGFGLQILPHSFFVKKYRDVLHHYDDGEKPELPTELLNTANKVLQDCRIKDKYSKLIRFFPIFGFNPHHLGSNQMITGAWVGLPANFVYASVNDVNTRNLHLAPTMERDFSWKSEKGLRLLSTLIISEKAKRFAIAREIHYANSYKQHSLGTCNMLGVLATYAMSASINQRFNLYIAHQSARLILYFISAGFGAMLSLLLRDACNCFYDRQADVTAASMGKDYAEGGVEYYTQLLARNKEFHNVLKSDKFTKFGNEERVFRTPHLPLTHRLDLVKETLNELVQKESSSVNFVKVNGASQKQSL